MAKDGHVPGHRFGIKNRGKKLWYARGASLGGVGIMGTKIFLKANRKLPGKGGKRGPAVKEKPAQLTRLHFEKQFFDVGGSRPWYDRLKYARWKEPRKK